MRWPALALLAAVPLVLDPGGWNRFGPAKWLVASAVAGAGMGHVVLAGRLSQRRVVTRCWLVLLAVVLVSAMAGVDPLLGVLGDSRRFYGFISYVLFFVACLLGSSAYGGSVRPFTRALTVGLVPVAGYAVAQMAGLDPLRWESTVDLGRARSTLGNAGFLGGYLAMALPLAVGAAFDTGERRRWRLLHSAAAATAALALLGTGTRGSWLGAVAGLVVLGWTGRAVVAARIRRARRAVVVGAASVLVALAVASTMGAVSAADLTRGTAGGRLDTWRLTANVVAERPLLGWGPEGFRAGFPRVATRQWVARYGLESIPDRAHNLLLDVTASIGVAGLVAYGALLLVLARSARRAIRTQLPQASAVVAGLVAYLVHAQFLFDTFELGVLFWVLGGLVVAVGGGTQQGEAPRAAMAALAIVGVVIAVAGVGWGLTAVAADRFVGRAAALTRAGRTDAAMAYLERSAELRPRALDHHLAAASLARASRDPSALARAHRLLSRWRHDAHVRLADAEVLAELGGIAGDRAALQNAVSTYRSVLAEQPMSGRAWLGLGRAQLLLGRPAAARRPLLAAASLLPRSPAPHLHLARAELADSRTSEARRHLGGPQNRSL